MRRTIEIEEATNLYFIHPLSGRLVSILAKLDVSPNSVSLAGMICGVLAGIAYYHYRSLGFTVAGLLLMIAWHVFDGADGQLARLTQRQSPSGKILDGICDYVTFASVYIGLALAITYNHGPWVWGLVTTSGVCHALQAAAYEAQRQDYEFWGLGKDSAKVPDSGISLMRPLPLSRMGQAGQQLYRLYVRLQHIATGSSMSSRRQLTAIFARAPGQAASIRSWYRKVFAPSVRRWSVMSANYRTMAIFLFSAFKTPVSYFVFEVCLTMLLVAMLLGQKKRYAMLFSGLGDLEQAAYDAAPAAEGMSRRG